MDRRSFLASSAAASTALWLPKTSIAQTRPLNYYNVNAFSGNFAVSGKFSDYGVRASIKAFGNGLGRPFEVDLANPRSTGQPTAPVALSLEIAPRRNSTD